jgi:hypothetical protein
MARIPLILYNDDIGIIRLFNQDSIKFGIKIKGF